MEPTSITRITPEQLGYRDRGIVKWLGMMLSDHSEALKKEKNKLEVKAKEMMTEEEVAMVLQQAFATKSPVLIQANTIRDGNYYKDVECKVAGYAENQIYLCLKDGRVTSCTLEEIRNIEWMNPLNWYDNRNNEV
ncbi:hypothetical protein [Gracilibacillus phocaeensis]|uniref:hypothetical protein n=1 Tax=Gracilibacillus phocaeensis TaxID=2042304 RepID=UPI0010325627|nr:hypothetical protein [Gracilibacillus phocaeensis]